MHPDDIEDRTHWSASVYVILPANRVDPEDHLEVAEEWYHDEDEAERIAGAVNVTQSAPRPLSRQVKEPVAANYPESPESSATADTTIDEVTP